ncbi:hypothetical protein J0H58_12615 [bacterium]|nr:hypothetical protein [bacterium]
MYVPDTFDQHVHLPGHLHRHADCARYFLHRVVWGRVQRRLTLDQYVPVKFDYLRSVIPDRVVKPLKLALLDAGVVECDGQYVEGEKALGYRLRPPHSAARIVRTRLSDGATADKVRANRRAEFKRIRLDVHRHLLGQYRRLEIDLPLALHLLEGDPDFEVNKIPPQQIAERDWSFSVCRYGRVHTDLTRCPRAVRPALRVDGLPLIEIDVANSQPLFLALLLINHRRQGNKTFGYVTFPEKRTNPYSKIDEIVSRTIIHFSQREENTITPLPPLSITTRMGCDEEEKCLEKPVLVARDNDTDTSRAYQDILKQDEICFIQLCENGGLYEDFMDRLELPVRMWVKAQFFEVIYGDNRSRSPLKADFAEVFPNVAEVVRVHKRKDHGFLPRLMQNIEANFVINTVCRRLMKELPEAPVLTIHDCVLTTPPYEDAIAGVMREEFARLGLHPTFHIKRHGGTPQPEQRGQS